MKRLLAMLALLVGASPLAAGAEDCRLHIAASVTMGIDEAGGVYLPMSIGSNTVNLLVDTGGLDSMLSDAAVAKLGLSTQVLGAGIHVTMFGGKRIDRYATARDVVFGGLTTPSMRFLVMPDGALSPGLDGTIAPDILRAYDDDFDFANAKFNLISPEHCTGQVIYWTSEPHTEIEFTLDGPHVTLPVTLDGQQITAEIDTGSSRSLFTLEEAERLFGFDANSPLLTSLGGGRSYKYAFKTLSFGGVTVANPDILLVPDAKARLHRYNDRIILGMGVLRQLHLYIAYHEKKLYITAASAH